MNRSSRRASRSLLSLALTTSAALGAISLPQHADAQMIGGLGQRPSGGMGSINAPAPQQPPRQQQPRQQAPVFSSPFGNSAPTLPTQNNNAPVFSRPGGGFGMPPVMSGNPLPQGNTSAPDDGAYRRWRNGGIEASSSGRGSGNYGGQGASNSRVYQPRMFGSGNYSPNRPVLSGTFGSPSVRVTTPIGQRSLPRNYYDNNYLYNAPVTIIGGPTLLGGYYYGNYCDTYYSGFCYPSVFSVYYGFPRYIVSPSLIVIGEPYYPTYYTNFLPFDTPNYQVTYNQNNYYVASRDTARDIEQGGEPAKQALKTSYPADSYQAAFADIEQAWNEGRITPLRKHLREDDVKLSVYFKGKYTYSIASADFAQITRDAFDRLNTVSFRFTRLRKAKNGDLTAYGKHVYRASSDDASRQDTSAKADDTVPFSTDGSRMYSNADDPAQGQEKTVYVSYTLRRHDGQWYIIGVNSSPTDMAH